MKNCHDQSKQNSRSAFLSLHLKSPHQTLKPLDLNTQNHATYILVSSVTPIAFACLGYRKNMKYKILSNFKNKIKNKKERVICNSLKAEVTLPLVLYIID